MVDAVGKGGRNAARRPEERLKHLETRQRVTGKQAAARSVIVRRARIALPVLAFALVGALVLNAREDSQDDAFLEDFAAIDATPKELEMAKPRFAGVDDKGRPYEITAEEARQETESDDAVELLKPRAVIKSGDDDSHVVAERGVYRKGANELELSETVRLEHQIGAETYVLTTPAARVRIDAETVESDAGVEGTSKSGALRADRMRAYNGEGRVVFEGNVRLRLDPKAARIPPAPPPAGEPQ